MTETELRHLLNDEAATIAVAEKLSKLVEPGDLIALSGDLGAGKSTLARAFIRAALQDPNAEVPSPTFTLVQEYEHPAGYPIFHADLYRLELGEGVEDLGLEDEQQHAVMLIEWPDRLPKGWHENTLQISLELRTAGSGERLLVVRSSSSGWQQKLMNSGNLGMGA